MLQVQPREGSCRSLQVSKNVVCTADRQPEPANDANNSDTSSALPAAHDMVAPVDQKCITLHQVVEYAVDGG